LLLNSPKKINWQPFHYRFFIPKKYDNKILRFCFAKKDETLEKAAEIINKL
jgi:hypothetical protein